MSKQSRFWTFTSYSKDEPDWDADSMSYLIFQTEKCPSTGRLHYQGYVEFKKKIGFRAAKLHFDDKCHLEIRKGTQEEAIEYCMKDESYIEGRQQFGTPSGGQGTRTDLENVVDFVKRGASIDDIYESFPLMAIKYGNGINNYINYHYKTKSKSWRVIDTTVIWGPPGTGKTKSVYTLNDSKDIYKLTQTTQSVWFDGYAGERVLLLDDFDGWITYKFLLNILDGYPLRIPIKGGHAYAQWTKVYITSNSSPEEWWNGHRDEVDALKRRINDIVILE